jgi:hypothetical protein
MEKHINKIAIEILKDEYSDYPENDIHYDREYKMLVRAQQQIESLKEKLQKSEQQCKEYQDIIGEQIEKIKELHAKCVGCHCLKTPTDKEIESNKCINCGGAIN